MAPVNREISLAGHVEFADSSILYLNLRSMVKSGLELNARFAELDILHLDHRTLGLLVGQIRQWDLELR